MSTRCIACKREISATQKNCFICGTKQSYFSYYAKYLVLISIVALISTWFTNNLLASKTLELQAKQIESTQQLQLQFDQQKNILEQKISDLSKSKTMLDEKISSLELKIADGSSNSENANKQLEAEKSKTSWLRRENNRFTTKIKTLTEQISNLEQQLNNAASSAEHINNTEAINQPSLSASSTIPLNSNIVEPITEEDNSSESDTDL